MTSLQYIKGINEHKDLTKLKVEKGWAGYGLYCALMELLWQNSGYVECNYAIIAYELRADVNQLQSLVEDYTLFKVKECDNKQFLCSETIFSIMKEEMKEIEQTMFINENSYSIN